MIPLLEGDARQLPLFTKKIEYILNTFRGGAARNMYLFHVITSRLAEAAANLVGERDNIDTWQELKNLLNQHFGDPRTGECLLLKLEALTIQRGESYLDFCHRIQNLRSILIAKFNETKRREHGSSQTTDLYPHIPQYTIPYISIFIKFQKTRVFSSFGMPKKWVNSGRRFKRSFGRVKLTNS
ncbi:hypothetical protein ABMA27_003369 [Loxostege sticticalis]|uniref:Retrotransposon gag domain-containing protein n=1 Tax=Loxostege sticticalis TaxID=481309 RepID=A0ABR3HSX0_LOXSC